MERIDDNMGVYDVIRGTVKCPKCGNIFEAEEQVKWTNECFLHTYEVGDEIDAANGEYDWATGLRGRLYDVCGECKVDVNLKAIVEDGILKEIKVIGYKE